MQPPSREGTKKIRFIVFVSSCRIMGSAEWQSNYQKLVPLVDSGSREIFTIVE